jgi:hypothetical protein
LLLFDVGHRADDAHELRQHLGLVATGAERQQVQACDLAEGSAAQAGERGVERQDLSLTVERCGRHVCGVEDAPHRVDRADIGPAP